MTLARPIGYYVHHHGAGHRVRAMAMAAEARGRITLIGTGLAGKVGDTPYLDLADDRLTGVGFAGADGAANRPDALHYAPINHPGIRARTASIARWIADTAPALMVVDVSVEVAMLARLASVPTVVVRLNGVRCDAAHADAFRGATALLAPFAADLDDPATPPEITAKTAYRPGLVERPPRVPIDPGVITVVLGAGGGGGDASVWAAAARAVPEMQWHIVGTCDALANAPSNLTLHGWIADAAAHVARSGVVVGGGGNGTVGTVLAAARPFVCVPQDRPFGEQASMATALDAAGAAIRCDDPATADWRSLIDRARRLSPEAAARLDDPAGPTRAAAWLIALADRDEDRR